MGVVFLIVIIVIAVWVLASCVRIVPQAFAVILERLGAYQATWSTGIHFKVPFIERVARKVNLKEQVVDFLDRYNKKMEKAGKDEQVISYTDVVGTLMSSVTDIVNTISYVLIAFVAISLVVSSIMIGVITYISVLERK